MFSGSSASRFQAAAGLRVVTLDDDAVVFNPFSWETHVLNAAAALVLEMAIERPCTAGEVVDLMAELLSDDARGDAAEHANRLLDDLRRLRLLVEVSDGDDPDR